MEATPSEETAMSTDVVPLDTTTTPERNGVHPPPARPVLPRLELFEFEPEGLGPLSEDLKAGLADSKWIDAELYAGRLREYAGKHIAVVNRQVVAVGDSQLDLIYDTAGRLGVLPCRVAVSFVGYPS